jgi:hypothetical protein
MAAPSSKAEPSFASPRSRVQSSTTNCLGYVRIFSSTCHLLQRLEHGDWLNAPWGVALAPLDFGNSARICLSGSSRVAAPLSPVGTSPLMTLATGHFEGLLQDASGNPLAVNGIWSLSPRSVSPANADAAAAPSAEMYFTAGPNRGDRRERAINLICLSQHSLWWNAPANGCIPPRGAVERFRDCDCGNSADLISGRDLKQAIPPRQSRAGLRIQLLDRKSPPVRHPYPGRRRCWMTSER